MIIKPKKLVVIRGLLASPALKAGIFLQIILNMLPIKQTENSRDFSSSGYARKLRKRPNGWKRMMMMRWIPLLIPWV